MFPESEFFFLHGNIQINPELVQYNSWALPKLQNSSHPRIGRLTLTTSSVTRQTAEAALSNLGRSRGIVFCMADDNIVANVASSMKNQCSVNFVNETCDD